MPTRNGIILLAAGSSRRLGRPKQLLSYQGNTLIRRSVQVAERTNPAALVVVVGAIAELVTKEISEQKIDIVFNPHFQEGIASSIRCGVDFILTNYEEIENIIIMVCDQPYVNETHIRKLINEQQRTKVKIVASSYARQLGVPALFNNVLFKELSCLKGDTGAKGLIQKYWKETMAISFPLGEIDVDTEEVYSNLIIATNDKQQ
ncbi:nucleotidyltransferase family protein [Olivibacter sp. CPCC 100613]|uniref:nucleotidyltransferase family protein n=1 Tax=Olivibacter sp. CPCC 100613 TaxID=3079931 RepID=UPI002FF821D8